MTATTCVLCGSADVYGASTYVDMFDVARRNLSCRDCGQDWTDPDPKVDVRSTGDDGS